MRIILLLQLVGFLRIAANVFGLGAVERQSVRWQNGVNVLLPAGCCRDEKYF